VGFLRSVYALREIKEQRVTKIICIIIVISLHVVFLVLLAVLMHKPDLDLLVVVGQNFLLRTIHSYYYYYINDL